MSRLTERSCPISKRIAIHRFLAPVVALTTVAMTTLQGSLFLFFGMADGIRRHGQFSKLPKVSLGRIAAAVFAVSAR